MKSGKFIGAVLQNFTLLFIFYCPWSFAENPETSAITPIVITPPLSDSLSIGLGDSTIVPGSYMSESPSTQIDDVLRQFSGFTTFRRTSSRSANPTTQGASLRGTAPTATSRTSVLFNNIPINDPFGGWVQWNRLSPELIDQVEVSRGASGASAYSLLDGIIKISSNPRWAKANRLSFYGGSRGSARTTSRQAMDLGDNTRLELSGDLNRSDGQYVIRASDRGDIDTRAGFQSLNTRAHSSTVLDTGEELTFLIDYFGEKRSNGTGLTENSTNSLIISTGLSSDPVEPWWHTQAYAQVQEFESFFSAQSEQRDLETPALDQYSVPSMALGISGSANTELAKNLGLFSELSIRWVWGETKERFRFIDGIANRQREAGGQELQLDALGGAKVRLKEEVDLSFLLHAKLWERLNGSRVEEDIISGEELRNNTISDSSRFLIGPRVELEIAQFKPLFLKGSLYHSFRTPTLNELYRPFRVRNDITEANSSLKPEKLFGADIGIGSKNEDSEMKLNLFWSSVEDSILNVTLADGPGTLPPCGFVPEGGICRQRQNIGKLISRGLEGDIQFTVFDTFDWGVSYQYLDSRIRSAPNAPQLEDKYTPQVPQHRGSLRLTYGTAAAGTLTLLGRYEDSRFEDDLNTRRLDQYITLDSYYSIGLSEKLDLIFQMENIANSKIITGETGEGVQTIGTPFFALVGLRADI